MSNYDKETKFYWLQLKEDFFEDDAIEWLEEQKPNGRDYAYFYLKLCLKSLKSNGILIRHRTITKSLKWKIFWTNSGKEAI